MPLLVEDDVPTNPVDVRLLSSVAVMPRPDELPHLIEEFELDWRWRAWKRDDARWLLSGGC
jgi:hypothetical protein